MEGVEPISLALTQDSIPLRALPISLSSFNFSCLKSIAGKQGKGMNHVVLPYIGLFSICSRQRGKISAVARTAAFQNSQYVQSNHEVRILPCLMG